MLCLCGCDQETKISQITNSKFGSIKGISNRYVHGHHIKGSNNPHYNNGKTYSKNDGILLTLPNHPNARKNGTVLEHIVICSAVLGKPLPLKAIIHHWDKNNSNNKSFNLLICQDQSFHMVIHMRQKAYEQSGHADYRYCNTCEKWHSTKDMCKNRNASLGYGHICKVCHRDAERIRRKETKNVVNFSSRDL